MYFDHDFAKLGLVADYDARAVQLGGQKDDIGAGPHVHEEFIGRCGVESQISGFKSIIAGGQAGLR